MATEFICKIGTALTGRDFSLLSTWNKICSCDLTSASTRVYASTQVVGSFSSKVRDEQEVILYRAGVAQDCRGILLHATDTQTLVTNISGTITPQANDQWRESSLFGCVTITNAGDSAIAVAECYNDSELLDYLVFSDWHTNSTNYIKVYTPTSERHTGQEGTGFCIYKSTKATLFDLRDIDIWIQGIEFKGGGYQISCSYREDNHTIKIEACILHDNNWGSLIDLASSANTTVKIWNCLLYNCYPGCNSIDAGYNIFSTFVENCTIYNPGSGYGVAKSQCMNTVVHRGDSNYPAFSPECSGDYNCDGLESGADNSAPGLNAIHNKSLEDILWTRWYSDQVGNEPDFSIGTDSCLVGVGTDLTFGSIGFTTDIKGVTRGSIWDIGAFQISS